MKRLMLAASLSLGLHALFVWLTPRARPPVNPVDAIESVAVDVELMEARSLAKKPAPPSGGGERSVRRQHLAVATAARGAPRQVQQQPELLPVLAEPFPDADENHVPSPWPTAGPSQVSAATLAAVATRGASPPGSGEGIGGGPNLGAFVERLKRSARRCAPRRAGPGSEASLARVRFCVDPQGRPEAMTLLQSTGDPRLDRAAVECVIPGAAPLPVTDRCLVVPLRFSL